MIKPEELRLGNYVFQLGIDYDSVGNKIIDSSDTEIVQVTLDILKQIEDESPLFEPIPLTPEILEKCGFGHALEGRITFYAHLKHDWFLIGGNKSYQFFSGATHIGEPFTNVHQLQNLYYALAGEELSITIPQLT